ncbi:hypothetical protein [Ruthenibacterium lactatiformans]|mgnify:CR=1|uniref:hypothetical protein n=1 Tax=Ruthenibacterium lactatiformans TaxID=1550024 RepID=UPI0012E00F79|nr:hypothetical protein [Ruthenibacterium lactatiformans]
MVADLRKMQENQGVSENRIDKSRFIGQPSINRQLPVWDILTNGLTKRLSATPI